VVRPAAIAIVASTAGDGREVAARGLASSLASAGYSTLLVDTPVDSPSQSKSGPGPSLAEIGLQSTPDPKSGSLKVLTLGDLALQETTSQRDVQSALSIFRGKFDYVVISAEYGASKSFATSLSIAVDAVVVSVIKGRREVDDDARLAAALEDIGSRFLGVVALDTTLIKDLSGVTNVSATLNVRRGQATPLENGRKRRENAESAT
jgi:Mrp family chromosome partitioning ATPase